MAAKFVAALLIFVIGVVLGVLASSVLRTDSSEAPERPANVPDSALWAGGVDGGMWVECSATNSGALACRVYANVTGALVEDGEFTFVPNTIRPTFYSTGLIHAEVRFERVTQ